MKVFEPHRKADQWGFAVPVQVTGGANFTSALLAASLIDRQNLICCGVPVILHLRSDLTRQAKPEFLFAKNGILDLCRQEVRQFSTSLVVQFVACTAWRLYELIVNTLWANDTIQ